MAMGAYSAGVKVSGGAISPSSKTGGRRMLEYTCQLQSSQRHWQSTKTGYISQLEIVRFRFSLKSPAFGL